MIRRNKVVLAIASATLVALSCSGSGQGRRNIEAIADEYVDAYLENFPEMGTNLSLPGARHDRLTDNSREARSAWEAREDAWLVELDEIGTPTDIGSRDWVSYGIMREALAGSVAMRACRPELWAASGATAWHVNVPSIFEIQPVDTPDQRQQALDRLSRLPEFLDNEIANLREGLAAGYSAPRNTVPAAIEASRALQEQGSPLLSPGVRAENPAYAARLNEVFDRQVVPAIERYADFLEETYLLRAREDISVAANPSGEACYPAAVRYFATVTPTPDEIHTTGLEQIAGIRTEMQQIIDERFPEDTIESLMRRLSSDPEFTFRTREAVLDYSLNSLDRARDRMPEAFGTLPRAYVEIKPYPAYRENSGTGEYHSSSEDGTRPGIYYISVRNPESQSTAGQQSVLYHETYPGHHLQGAIALELGDRVHRVARYFWNSGYGEGWALYSERLADELGLYSGPLDRLGMLSDQAARAARLVVDSGIHHFGWSRQRAVEYMRSNTAWSPVDIESEIDRYIAWPGQATAYMLGMLEIRRLRDLAEAELEDDFELRDFHDRVLGYGSVTLPMLEDSIESWIREQR